MRRIIGFLALLLALCLLIGASAEAPVLVDRLNKPDENADFAFAEDAALCGVYYPQILDTDAAVIVCGGEVVMIDVSSQQQSNRVIALLHQLGVEEINYVINTHPHYDHLEGLEALAKEFKIDELKICFPEDTNDHMRTALAVCEQYGIPVAHFGDGDVLTVGDAKLEVMQLDDGLDINGRSAQIRLVYGERTQLFTADLTQKASQVLVDKYPAEKLKSDILKYPHHGLKELRKSFAETVQPLLAIITNNGGKRCKPSRTSCASFGIAYIHTVPGFVYTITDGQTWLADRMEPDVKLGDKSREDTRDFGW